MGFQHIDVEDVHEILHIGKSSVGGAGLVEVADGVDFDDFVLVVGNGGGFSGAGGDSLEARVEVLRGVPDVGVDVEAVCERFGGFG